MAKQAPIPEAPPFPFAPDEIVECIQAHWAWLPRGGDVFVRQGARMRASEQVVQLHPESFVRDGSTDREKAAALAAAIPEREPAPYVPAVAPDRVLLDIHAAVAVRQVLSKSHNDGMRHLGPSILVNAGDRLALTDPIVKNNPDAFVLVVPPSCTPENSLRATVTVEDLVRVAGVGYEAAGKPIIKGTWARKDHRLVLAHADKFEEITS